MLLHQQFVKMAKKNSKKMAIKDKTTKSEVPYGRALIGALILAKKFKKYDEGYIGIMIPTSAGCALRCIAARCLAPRCIAALELVRLLGRTTSRSRAERDGDLL